MKGNWRRPPADLPTSDVKRLIELIRRSAVVVPFVAAAACGDATPSTAPATKPNPVYAGYPGFDIAAYPGDAALTAWKFPTSPYHWVGVYLAAPCHRDATWEGQYKHVTALGWGTAVVYVGQQDWAAIPDLIPTSLASLASLRVSRTATLNNIAVTPALTAVTCSASLLTSDQGSLEGSDAATRAAGAGVPNGSAIFLDIEYVTSVSPALLSYMSSWISAVLSDGRFRPGIYCAKANAAALYGAATAAYAAAQRHDSPPVWIASSAGFTITSAPDAVGLSYATVWQGLFDVSQSYANVTLTVDVDVANSPSPSTP